MLDDIPHPERFRKLQPAALAVGIHGLLDRIAELEENARSNPDGVDGMRRTIEALGRVNAEQQRRIAELERELARRTERARAAGKLGYQLEHNGQESEIDRLRELLREISEAHVLRTTGSLHRQLLAALSERSK